MDIKLLDGYWIWTRLAGMRASHSMATDRCSNCINTIQRSVWLHKAVQQCPQSSYYSFLGQAGLATSLQGLDSRYNSADTSRQGRDGQMLPIKWTIKYAPSNSSSAKCINALRKRLVWDLNFYLNSTNVTFDISQILWQAEAEAFTMACINDFTSVTNSLSSVSRCSCLYLRHSDGADFHLVEMFTIADVWDVHRRICHTRKMFVTGLWFSAKYKSQKSRFEPQTFTAGLPIWEELRCSHIYWE